VRRVVVTGLGMINALGLDKESAFSAILEGKCGIRAIESFSTQKQSVTMAGEIKNFDVSEVLDGKEAKKADRFIQLGLKAAAEAMEDAKFEGEVDMERFGVASASGIGGLPNIEKNSVVCENRGPRRISPFFIPSSLVNMLGGFISIYQGMKGPNLSSVTACAAGTHAIGEAAKSIMVGTADKMMVVGLLR
jgi:3-oxoacyl-[acyl-carrier-protein] synthase II